MSGRWWFTRRQWQEARWRLAVLWLTCRAAWSSDPDAIDAADRLYARGPQP